MKKSIFLLGYAFVAGLGCLMAQSPRKAVIIQQFTVVANGATDTINFAPLVIDNSGNVTVSSNSKLSPTQYNATTANQLSSGVTNWVNSFSSPTNQKAFIVASCQDASGNIYVTGGVRTSTVNGLDIFVLGYDALGNQFMSGYYNGPNSTTDVGLAICTDNNGYVYVAGASDGLYAGITDYVTIAFNAISGAQQWATRYDYSGAMDVPTAILIDATGAVVVTGASGTSLADYDVATVRYKAGTTGGGQIGINRTANTGAGFDKPFGMTTDGAGNMYIAGTMYNAITGNYDVQVQKLDTSLANLWVQTYDGYGADDAGVGIALDAQGNVLVAGTSYKPVGSKELFVLKISSNGTPVKRFLRTGQTMDSEGLRLKIDGSGDIFVGGQYGSGAGQDVCLLVLDSTLTLLGEKIFNGANGLQDKFMDLAISSSKIYLSVRSFNGTMDDNLLVTYSYQKFEYTPVIDTLMAGNYVKDNIIVNFNKATLKMTAINDPEVKYGQLNDFVADSTCDKLTIALVNDDPKFDARKLLARKIVNLTEADSVSESRLGINVQVPQFFGGLLITLPSNINTNTAATAVAGIGNDVLRSQLDYLYELFWVPNDTVYPKQTNLHPSALYPNAHINCQPAWDRTTGEQFVRTGVFDTGVCQGGNPDIAAAENYNYVAGSTGGVDDVDGHGTCVASIIGGHTDNITGISGIAGGGNGHSGTSVINMRVGDAQMIAWHDMKQAFIDGASGSNLANGKALHIINCSFGMYASFDAELLESVNFVNRNNVAFVCARGNKLLGPGNTLHIGAPGIPGTLKPKITMCVGASGTDGHYHKSPTNGTLFDSMDSLGVDFVAPGDLANVYAAKIPATTNPPWSVGGVNSVLSVGTYGPFNGTSAATPHVSGLVALMMSYRNQNFSNWDNIIHEDCEAIIKRTATDLHDVPTYHEAIGYDEQTGYGRINADSAIHVLEPQYKIRHIDPWHYITGVTTSTTIVHSNATMSWNQTTFGPPGGNYIVDVIEVQKHYSYNYSGETFLDAWPVYGTSTGYTDSYLSSSTIKTDEPGNVELVSVGLTGATTKTYVYHIKSLVATGALLSNVYVPTVPANIESVFTLYTLGSVGTGVHTQQAQVDYFNVYPNPSNGTFTLGFSSKKETKGTITITDIMGKAVYEKQQLVASGLNRYDLTIDHLNQGIYFLSLEIESNKVLVKKLIIE